MALVEGFEPPTRWLTATRSTWLSYTRIRASDRNRTRDILLTRQALYLLSYTGIATLAGGLWADLFNFCYIR